MKIYEDSLMIGTNGCGQPDIKSRYSQCQSPILKRPQLAKMKNKLQTSNCAEHFDDYRKTYCNCPKAPLAFPHQISNSK